MNRDFRNIPIKIAYSSDIDDVLWDFYIPVLEASVGYKRLSGYFTSSSMALAARGILGLIKNGGYSQLIVSPKLTPEDVEIISRNENSINPRLEKKLIEEIEVVEEDFIRDHFFALAWMICNKKLEIKIAIVYDERNRPLDYDETEQLGLFHQKVGILRDVWGNIISFSGSTNESAKGWFANTEELKVFRSWEAVQNEYVQTDISKFERFWNNQSGKVRIMNIPDAVRQKLVEIAPDNIEGIFLEKHYRKMARKKVSLFDYQKEAVQNWIQNTRKGIFEMATGTGKTFTALACVDDVLRKTDKLAIVVASPFAHLVQQWKREIVKYGLIFDATIIADSTNPLWKNVLADTLVDIKLGHRRNCIILTTHDTLTSTKFTQIVKENTENVRYLLVADEVHGLGAEKSRNRLLDEFEFRLGLSATPKRWFDSIGTTALYRFFDKVVFEFSLRDAINNVNPITNETYLTPYRYLIYFISLEDSEIEEYIELTRSYVYKISRAKGDAEREKQLENILFKRADIVRNASRKMAVLRKIIDAIITSIEGTIIYCSPQQIDSVIDTVKEKKLLTHRFTMNEGTKPEIKFGLLSEREFLIKKFSEGTYQILVAMKCLDEGVDIPPARKAILMASSGNPREYIQRIGRVIRRYPGKKEAIIYDIVVKPSLDRIPSELRRIEINIFAKEISRCEEIASIALNSVDVLSEIYKVKNKILEH